MKKFIEGGEYFVLSSYQIKSVPIVKDDAGEKLAKTICEDACYLSASGGGQTSIELLRIAGEFSGSKIQHILTLRTHDSSEKDCVIRQEALIKGVLSLLHRAGYIVEEITYDTYRKASAQSNKEAVWALKKKDVQEYGVQGTYKSPSVVDDVDWERIYSAIDGSGCSLCIQIIPMMLAESECRLINKNLAQCSQAVDGMVSNMRDSLAGAAAERWKYFSNKTFNPFAEVNLLVLGSVANSALVTARVKQSFQGTAFNTVKVSKFDSYSIHNQPWKISLDLRAHSTSVLERWASEEVSKIFKLPSQTNYFVGVNENAYSLMPEVDLLPEQLTSLENQKLRLGSTVYSTQNIYAPLEQFLLHTAVMGKSGVGKTTFLKQMIARFNKCNIPVLIMEPVKREYRDMITGIKGSIIYTVERPITPLLINPFFVPEGVRLGEYRSSLLSAFKAAFSLPDPLPALFEKAISEAYACHGWKDQSMSTDADVAIFGLVDFINVFKRIIARSTYSNEVKGNMMSGGAFRLQSLIERCPHTFDTMQSTSIKDLLNGCAVLEMGNLEPEQKSLVSALTLISILAYLKATRESNNLLKNIILIDEAHALLDQGEGATQGEKALNSTMTQLMINVITEIRAYGVGVIFSDQSPSRVGGRMLDNVDNIISFRLSGEEAEMLKKHIGGDDCICDVLPLMAPGEFLLKNRFLRTALPIRADYDEREAIRPHVTDARISEKQTGYIVEHAKEYRPFVSCGAAGCERCNVRIRDAAKNYALQIFSERQHKLKTAEEIAAHIIKIPTALKLKVGEKEKESFEEMCGCVAAHLLRKCSLENNISFTHASVAKLLEDMRARIRERGDENE